MSETDATPLIASQITGLYETHLPVTDLARARAFYQDILGLPLARHLPARRVAFLWVGSPESAMLGLWETGSAPLGMQLHFAFRMAAPALLELPARLISLGVQPLGFNGEAVTEPLVIGWMPALSLYCRDPDGHSVEFIAKLPDQPDLEFGQQPYSHWQAQRS
ncbi:VOC family protein [Pseudophaeobacter sp.]|uniref:VOC family protein n=1 Tax=Pseudophaeobacter sp. TaxID=1971739 RepID=UPI0032984E95